MAGESCPYCGTLLTTSLKFCVNCRRSVTEDKIRKGSSVESDYSDELDESTSERKFKLSRGNSYDSIRSARTFFFTSTTLLTIFFVYYFVMKFVIHQPIPFESQLSLLIDDLGKGRYSDIIPHLLNQGSDASGLPQNP
ncbi:MAG: hypothetical protein K2X27_11115 [Candidatus Obscuribacterales bacterium]|nr:hypothetical protein [Candidatus Obscuribacterales bacterium]